MKLPKKPTAKKLPKMPKASASLESHNAWRKKVSDIEKENSAREKEWKSNCDRIKKEREEVKKIRAKGLSGIFSSSPRKRTSKPRKAGTKRKATKTKSKTARKKTSRSRR